MFINNTIRPFYEYYEYINFIRQKHYCNSFWVINDFFSSQKNREPLLVYVRDQIAQSKEDKNNPWQYKLHMYSITNNNLICFRLEVPQKMAIDLVAYSLQCKNKITRQ